MSAAHTQHNLTQVPPSPGVTPQYFFQVTTTICRYPFILLGGERHCESKVFGPRTQRIVLVMARMWTPQSRVQHTNQRPLLPAKKKKKTYRNQQNGSHNIVRSILLTCHEVRWTSILRFYQRLFFLRWFLSFALRIPTAQNFTRDQRAQCVISLRT